MGKKSLHDMASAKVKVLSAVVDGGLQLCRRLICQKSLEYFASVCFIYSR